MFRQCEKLTTIYSYADLDLTAATSKNGMFDLCYLLVGGAGTSYSASYTSANYAIIDTAGGWGSGNGYLTLKV